MTFYRGTCAISYFIAGVLCLDRFTSKAYLSSNDPLVCLFICLLSEIACQNSHSFLFYRLTHCNTTTYYILPHRQSLGNHSNSATYFSKSSAVIKTNNFDSVIICVEEPTSLSDLLNYSSISSFLSDKIDDPVFSL